MPGTPVSPDPNAPHDFLISVPPKMWDDYFYALGKFTHMFGRCEETMASLITNFLTERLTANDNRKLHILKALTGGLSLETSKDTLLRLLRITDAQPITINEVGRIFRQLTLIQAARNRLAHSPAAPLMTNKRGYFSMANSTKAKEFVKANVRYFKPEMLLNMAADLERIPNQLHFAISPVPSEYMTSQIEEHLVALRRPWQFHPSQLKPPAIDGGPQLA